MGIMHPSWTFSTLFHALLYISVITPFWRHILRYKKSFHYINSMTTAYQSLFPGLLIGRSFPQNRTWNTLSNIFGGLKYLIFFLRFLNFPNSFHWTNYKTNFTYLSLLIFFVYIFFFNYSHCSYFLLLLQSVFLNASFCFWNMTEKA